MGGLTAHTLADRLIWNIAPRAIRTVDKSTNWYLFWRTCTCRGGKHQRGELGYRRCAFGDADNAFPELIKNADAAIKLDIDRPRVCIVARNPWAFGE